MGWRNGHLHQFTYNKHRNIIGDPEAIESDDVMDSKIFWIKDYFNKPQKKITYVYRQR